MERALPDGYEVVESTIPAVVTASYEIGALREPGVEAFMTAGKKPITVWNARDLGLSSDTAIRTSFIKMYQPANDIICESELVPAMMKSGELASIL